MKTLRSSWLGPLHLFGISLLENVFLSVKISVLYCTRKFKRIFEYDLHKVPIGNGPKYTWTYYKHAMGLLQLAVTWYMLEGKLPPGTSKTKRLHQDKFEFLCFGCPSGQLSLQHVVYHVTASCKRPIVFIKLCKFHAHGIDSYLFIRRIILLRSLLVV